MYLVAPYAISRRLSNAKFLCFALLALGIIGYEPIGY